MKNICRYAWVALLLPSAGCGPTNEFIGKAAPDFLVSPVKPEGDVRLSSFRGKVVLLDFWATWCGPCKQLMPRLAEMQAKYGAKGFVVLGITSDPIDVAASFQRMHPEIGYEFFADSKMDASTKFKVSSLPTTVLIGRDGNVVFYDVGYSDDSFGDLDQKVADLVG